MHDQYIMSDPAKFDFLMGMDTNRLGPQFKKLLFEVASWEYESICLLVP